MLMAGSVVGSQLPVERDVLLTQLRSSSWRDREAAVLALIDAHPTDANLLKRLDVQYVFLWLAERENEALWRRYVAGMDSENDGYGNYYDLVGELVFASLAHADTPDLRARTIRVLAGRAFNGDSRLVRALARYGETATPAMTLTRHPAPIKREAGVALLTRMGEAWRAGRMLTAFSRHDREHAVARLREGLRDSDTTVQRVCIEGVVAWRDRSAVPLLEQLMSPPSGTYDARATIADAARLARAKLLGK